MAIVRKYKALGEMVPRSKVGGGEFVRLEDYEALQVERDAIELNLRRMDNALAKASVLKDTNVGYAASSGATVPPAGDVEVAGYRYRSLPDEWELMDESPFPDGRAFCQFGRETLEPVYSHAHITHLTAERDGLMALADRRKSDQAQMCSDIVALQSELTKAQELLTDMPAHWFAQRINEILDHQSAPADQNCEWEDTFGPDYTGEDAPAACWTPANHECPGDGVGACKKCPNAPAAKGGE